VKVWFKQNLLLISNENTFDMLNKDVVGVMCLLALFEGITHQVTKLRYMGEQWL
jgi:hypothetical protein